MIAAGGWPVYRSKYADHSIPEIYENVDFFRNAERWDFSSFRPDVIVIALGTNDFSYLSDLSEEKALVEKARVKEEFIAFLRRVSALNEGAKIFLLCGFFEYEGLSDLTKEVRKESEIENAFVVETKSAVSLSDVRAGHPGRKTHRLAAKRLVEAIRKAVF